MWFRLSDSVAVDPPPGEQEHVLNDLGRLPGVRQEGAGQGPAEDLLRRKPEELFREPVEERDPAFRVRAKDDTVGRLHQLPVALLAGLEPPVPACIRDADGGVGGHPLQDPEIALGERFAGGSVVNHEQTHEALLADHGGADTFPGLEPLEQGGEARGKHALNGVHIAERRRGSPVGALGGLLDGQSAVRLPKHLSLLPGVSLAVHGPRGSGRP